MPNGLPHLFVRRRRIRLPALLRGLTLSAAIAFSSGSAVAEATSTYQIPAAIADDCSVDVTQPILSWIDSVPDNSTLSFSAGACYRIEGALELFNRNGLDFEGNGATFKATTTGEGTWRSQWRLFGGAHFIFRNMTIRGPRPVGGTFVSDLQYQHAFDLNGVADVEIDHANASNVYGDCVYISLGYDSSSSWSSNIHVHDSSCTGSGRMGIAVVAGRDVLVERSSFDSVGLVAFDVEPNGLGFGAERVTFTDNQIGSVGPSVFDVTGSGPVDSVTFSSNTVSGEGLRIAVITPAGQRRSNITITGNVSDTGYYAPGSVAMDFVRVDGLTVMGNTVPLSGANMALADVSESCNVNVSGNSYPGGVVEARLHPYDCGLPAAPTLSSFTPASGPAAMKVTITGSNLTGATAVAFNAASASFTVDSDTQITATVPSAGASGPISVTTPGGTANSPTNFTVVVDNGSARGCTLVGTEGDDTLVGTRANDVVCGLGGNDKIWGKEGNDVLYGDGGDDTLNGSSGDDVLVGGPGKDKLVGGSGNDQMYAESLAGAVVVGRVAYDDLGAFLRAGRESLDGGPGADRLVGSPWKDSLLGGPGADGIFGRAGDDVLIGGKGADKLFGAAGRDTLFSRDGRRDGVVGGSGWDRAQVDRRRDRVRYVESLF